MMRKSEARLMYDEVQVVKKIFRSEILEREVSIDFYFPLKIPADYPWELLLINDGQDLEKMDFAGILDRLYDLDLISPILAVGIHAGKERRLEYGTASQPDYLNRGNKAGLYTRFIFEELLPFIRAITGITNFRDKTFAGFSLGGLMAMDIVWNFPYEFRKVGVFSGSFWWRSVGLDEGYEEETDRIMHSQVRKGIFAPWLKFYFQTGLLDETADRNNNGIIDSIDDTLGLIDELEEKGYSMGDDIKYIEIADGRHDVETWGRAMPDFLEWAFGSTKDEG